jgi:hypothetical protein
MTCRIRPTFTTSKKPVDDLLAQFPSQFQVFRPPHRVSDTGMPEKAAILRRRLQPSYFHFPIARSHEKLAGCNRLRSGS